MLTNHDMDSQSPFATILLGQPTLAAKMALGTLAALEQRITVDSWSPPMSVSGALARPEEKHGWRRDGRAAVR